MFFSCTIQLSFAQAITGNAIPSVQFADANGRLLPASGAGILGTPYVFEKFGPGKVIFVNGMESMDSSLNYSYFDHKLYFSKSNNLYLVNQQAKEFILYNVDKENHKVAKQFKSLFPNVDDNTPATFYEVLGLTDVFQFLKYTHKRIKETTVYGSSPTKEYVADDVFYIYYITDKKMLTLGSSHSLKALKKALPSYASQMDALANANKLNLKKAEDVIQLLQQLKTPSN